MTISKYTSDIFKNIVSGLVVGIISVLGTVGAINATMTALKEDVNDIKLNQQRFAQEIKEEDREVKKRLRRLELLHAAELTKMEMNLYIKGSE